MNIRKAYIIFCMLCVLAAFGFSGCAKDSDVPTTETPAVNTEQPTQTPSQTQEPEQMQTQEPQETDNPQKPDNTAQSGEKKEISIYTINDNTLESEPVKVEVEKELTPETVVEAAVKSLEEHSLTIGIHSVTQEGDTVIVSFKKDTAPLVNVGSGVEETILNCISDSLIDNIEGCKNVIFRGEDGPYESGHLYFEMDEVYARE